eukprot:gene25223-10868_t
MRQRASDRFDPCNVCWRAPAAKEGLSWTLMKPGLPQDMCIRHGTPSIFSPVDRNRHANRLAAVQSSAPQGPEPAGILGVLGVGASLMPALSGFCIPLQCRLQATSMAPSTFTSPLQDSCLGIAILVYKPTQSGQQLTTGEKVEAGMKSLRGDEVQT